MQLLNERHQMRTVAERWRRAYSTPPYSTDKGKQAIGSALASLDPETATADDVAAIIGNRTWVCQCTCNECLAVTWDVVEFAQADQESSAGTLCANCLRDGLRLLGAA